MYRLTFNTEDMSRLRIATPGPFDETVLAAERARQRDADLAFGGWRRDLRGRLNDSVRPLADLFPRGRRGLDFIALVGTGTDIPRSVDALLSVAPSAFQAELEWLGTRHRLTTWSRGLGDRNPDGRRELATMLTEFHAAAVAPHWTHIKDRIDTEVAVRLRNVAAAGIGEMLSTICPPYVRWNRSVLEVDTPFAADATVELGGRGLVLVPSVFVGGYPYLSFDLADNGAAPRLIYSVVRDLADAHNLWRSRSIEGDLATLIGRTRTAVLQTTAEGRHTGEIARQLGVSAAAVSQHTAVLRANGLINTRREGPMSFHMITALGSLLLAGQHEDDSQ